MILKTRALILFAKFAATLKMNYTAIAIGATLGAALVLLVLVIIGCPDFFKRCLRTKNIDFTQEDATAKESQFFKKLNLITHPCPPLDLEHGGTLPEFSNEIESSYTWRSSLVGLNSTSAKVVPQYPPESYNPRKVVSVDSNELTILARPISWQTVQFDSFSRTIMLQNLILENIGDENIIREVRDGFLINTISLGGIVVVIKPFHGTGQFEFKSLETGDLLRIVKFFIMEDEDETGSSFGSIDTFIDKTHLAYSRIYCTGIILNSYLDYENSSVLLKVKNDGTFTGKEMDLLKDFPLKVVSLESTLLHVADSESVPESDKYGGNSERVIASANASAVAKEVYFGKKPNKEIDVIPHHLM